jgi:hypothetical protein
MTPAKDHAYVSRVRLCRPSCGNYCYFNGTKSKPAAGFLIHTSGTCILGDQSQGYGIPPDRVYDEIAGIKEITSFSMNHRYRNVVKVVLDAATSAPFEYPKKKTAIICPPTIYGIGIGLDRKHSV